MRPPSRKTRVLCALSSLLALANCATTQETVQDCKKAAYSYCDKVLGVKDGGAGGPGGADAAARSAAYQQCLDPQLAACRAE